MPWIALLNKTLVSIRSSLILVFLAVCLAGCINMFSLSYEPYELSQNLGPYVYLGDQQQPRVMRSTSPDDFDSQFKILLAQHYVPIGISDFTLAASPNLQGVSEQAKKINALVVLEGARYAGTEYQTVMQAVPIRTTTVEAERNDASTTKVVRQETEYVPVTQAYDQYQFTAIYFAKSEYKSALGIYAIDIPPSLRDKLQRNTGAVIKIVYEESPAFNANLMGG